MLTRIRFKSGESDYLNELTSNMTFFCFSCGEKISLCLFTYTCCEGMIIFDHVCSCKKESTIYVVIGPIDGDYHCSKVFFKGGPVRYGIGDLGLFTNGILIDVDRIPTFHDYWKTTVYIEQKDKTVAPVEYTYSCKNLRSLCGNP